MSDVTVKFRVGKMETLADFIDCNVDILAVGINPSPNSVRDGYPFATPQNRFWRALNESKLVRNPYDPSRESMQLLLMNEHIGFTDLVKRPTSGIAELRAGDYRLGTAQLLQKIRRFAPRILWFQGKVGYAMFSRYGLQLKPNAINWGAQPNNVFDTPIFVTPNPSPANAAYSFDDILRWINKLAEFAERGRVVPI